VRWGCSKQTEIKRLGSPTNCARERGVNPREERGRAPHNEDKARPNPILSRKLHWASDRGRNRNGINGRLQTVRG